MLKLEDLLKQLKTNISPTRDNNTHTILFLTSGKLNVNIAFHSIILEKNDFLIISAGQVVSYNSKNNCTGFICNFHIDFLYGKIGSFDLKRDFRFLNILNNPIIQPDKESFKYLNQLFDRIFHEYSLNTCKNSMLLKSYLIASLSELNQVYKKLFIDIKNDRSLELTNKFKELLIQNFKDNHSTKDYAYLLNVSVNHLNKCVKNVTGKSTSSWINEILILESKILLSQTNDPISQIAFDLGFEDPSYFSRFFKKHEKTSPLEFRKMIELS